MVRKIVVGILVVFAVAFTACMDDDNDSYSLNDMWIGFGVLQDDDSGAYTIVMDNKDVLVPLVSDDNKWQSEFKRGDRVWLNYSVLNNDLDSSTPRYFVRVNQIQAVLMKGIMDITPAIEDSIGQDPILVQEFWMTDSLLTFKLKYWGLNEIHFLNLVKLPGQLTANNQPIHLELRHNANNDEESIPYTAFVSFSLNQLRIEGQDSVRFEFSSSDYDGMQHSKEEVFRYEELNW